MRFFSLARPHSSTQPIPKPFSVVVRLLSLGAALGVIVLTVLPSAWAEIGDNGLPDPSEPDPAPQLPAHSDYVDAKKLLAQRKWAEAAIVLRSVLKKNPDYFPGAIELARALVYSGRREEALGILNQAIPRQTGTHQAALTERARVISRLFLTKATREIYQEGLNLLGQRKYRAARERFEKAAEAEPDNVEVLVRIGQCLVLDGDFDSAAERLRLAKRLDPIEPEVRLWLGRALHQRGELAVAIEELKFGYEGLEHSERAPIWYTDVLASSGNRKGAVSVLEEDIDAKPFHLLSLLSLARLRAELFREGADSLWSARKDLQVALSRLPKYRSTDLGPTEGELGVELHEAQASLKSEIESMLSQLDNRLQNTTPAVARQKK